MEDSEKAILIRAKTARWLEEYCPKHNTTDLGWVIILEVAKERYLQDADLFIAELGEFGVRFESDNQELPELIDRFKGQVKRVLCQAGFKRVFKASEAEDVKR